jgi:hypothetical protein
VDTQSIHGFDRKMAKASSIPKPLNKTYPKASARHVFTSYREGGSLLLPAIGYIRPFGRRSFGRHAPPQEIIAAVLAIITIVGLLWRVWIILG